MSITGGRKFFALIVLFWIPYMISLVWSYAIGNWDYLKFFTPNASAAFGAYLAANVIQKWKVKKE